MTIPISIIAWNLPKKQPHFSLAYLIYLLGRTMHNASGYLSVA